MVKDNIENTNDEMKEENEVEEVKVEVSEAEEAVEGRHIAAASEIRLYLSDTYHLCLTDKSYKPGKSLGMVVGIDENKNEGTILFDDGYTVASTVMIHAKDTPIEIKAKLNELEKKGSYHEGDHLYFLDGHATVLIDFGPYFDDLKSLKKIVKMCDNALCDQLAQQSVDGNNREVIMLKSEIDRRLGMIPAELYYSVDSSLFY